MEFDPARTGHILYFKPQDNSRFIACSQKVSAFGWWRGKWRSGVPDGMVESQCRVKESRVSYIVLIEAIAAGNGAHPLLLLLTLAGR